MGFFSDIMGGLFGTDAEMPGEISELVDFGKGLVEQNAGMGTEGFNMANLLMPILMQELGIQPTIKDGKITGFERVVDPNKAAMDKLEATTLKNLQMYSEGRGAVPVGVTERNKRSRETLRTQMRQSGFKRGDTPFDMAMQRLKTSIRETNDAFRHGQFGVASNLLNSISSNERADLGMFLNGAMSSQQSPLPWLNALIGNTQALSGLAGAAGGGMQPGQPGLIGTMLGMFGGGAGGALGSAWGKSLFSGSAI